MRMRRLVLCACVIAARGGLSAQAPSAAGAPQTPAGASAPKPAAAGAAKKAASAGSMSAALKQNWEGAKLNIKESATLMDEANYAFKPVDSVRSFGQILAHVAGASYVFCAAAKGEKSPFAEDEFEKTATTKATITKAVDDSIAYCDPVYDGLTDAKGSEAITMPFGMGQGVRSTALIINYGHLMEHYGNLATYFRIKGMVPPSTARAAAR